jgi:hypothetical protein
MANVKHGQQNQGQANLQTDRDRSMNETGQTRDNPHRDSSGGMENIRERMPVVGSCGNRVGVVDHVEGNAIKLTKNDSSDGQHHFIPVDWVDNVDNEVHLSKNSQDAQQQWKSNAGDCGC